MKMISVLVSSAYRLEKARDLPSAPKTGCAPAELRCVEDGSVSVCGDVIFGGFGEEEEEEGIWRGGAV